jgi:uncharacterized protein YlxP (DUF503 family)
MWSRRTRRVRSSASSLSSAVSGSGFVAVLVIDLHFPEAGSLKTKRKDLSSVKAQLHGRLGAAVSEIEHQDTWQRSTLAAALTGSSLAALSAHADRVERWLESRFPEGVSVERLIASVEDLKP